MKNRCIKVLAIMLLGIGGLSAQNSNVGYISRDSIVKSIPGYLEKIKQVDELTKKYDEELKGKRESIDQKLAALLRSYNIKQGETQPQVIARMSSRDTTALGMMRQEESLLTATTKLYRSKIQGMYEQEIKPVDESIIAAIKRYAVKNKLDMVYFIENISPALAYVNSRRYVTKGVIGELLK